MYFDRKCSVFCTVICVQVTVTNNGPCYGEVGNGERFRTQGIPKKMKELEFAHVMMVGTAANSAVYVLRLVNGHLLSISPLSSFVNITIVITRDCEEEDIEEMEEYDVLDQTDMEYTE